MNHLTIQHVNTMNLHPIFVHFPIALLTLYALCEFARFQKVKDQPSWFYLKAVLVIVGTTGAFAAAMAGDGAKRAVLTGAVRAQVANPHVVISAHEAWAKISVVIFTLLAAGYAVQWLNKFNVIDRLPGSALRWVWRTGTALQQLVTENSFVVVVLAAVGLISITVTGALGGSIVYGPNTDPVVHFIYQLLIG
jgi:uncharacterized membrane protein